VQSAVRMFGLLSAAVYNSSLHNLRYTTVFVERAEQQVAVLKRLKTGRDAGVVDEVQEVLPNKICRSIVKHNL